MIDALQWLGAILGVVGAWLVASEQVRTRWSGFACFLASNLCWITSGIAGGSWALVAMQAVFCVTSARGLIIARRLMASERERARLLMVEDGLRPGIGVAVQLDHRGRIVPGTGLAVEHRIREEAPMSPVWRTDAGHLVVGPMNSEPLRLSKSRNDEAITR
jgi:hypothetical protein